MDSNQTVLVSLNIDNHPIRLRVAQKDETQVLKAAELLNNRIEGFKRFGTSNPLDRISWASLDLAGEVLRQTTPTPLKTDHEDQSLLVLEEIETLLSDI
jgi:hypothetical protein